MQNPATWRRRCRSATCKGGVLHNAQGKPIADRQHHDLDAVVRDRTIVEGPDGR